MGDAAFELTRGVVSHNCADSEVTHFDLRYEM